MIVSYLVLTPNLAILLVQHLPTYHQGGPVGEKILN